MRDLRLNRPLKLDFGVCEEIKMHIVSALLLALIAAG